MHVLGSSLYPANTWLPHCRSRIKQEKIGILHNVLPLTTTLTALLSSANLAKILELHFASTFFLVYLTLESQRLSSRHSSSSSSSSFAPITPPRGSSPERERNVAPPRQRMRFEELVRWTTIGKYYPNLVFISFLTNLIRRFLRNRCSIGAIGSAWLAT